MFILCAIVYCVVLRQRAAIVGDPLAMQGETQKSLFGEWFEKVAQTIPPEARLRTLLEACDWVAGTVLEPSGEHESGYVEGSLGSRPDHTPHGPLQAPQRVPKPLLGPKHKPPKRYQMSLGSGDLSSLLGTAPDYWFCDSLSW